MRIGLTYDLREDYAVAATLADFYRPGDGKVIFSKTLPAISGSSTST